MKLHGELAIGALESAIIGTLLAAKHFIEIAFGQVELSLSVAPVWSSRWIAMKKGRLGRRSNPHMGRRAPLSKGNGMDQPHWIHVKLRAASERQIWSGGPDFSEKAIRAMLEWQGRWHEPITPKQESPGVSTGAFAIQSN
jgi:hypothetical protein